mgnify:CR=1 FL=1
MKIILAYVIPDSPNKYMERRCLFINHIFFYLFTRRILQIFVYLSLFFVIPDSPNNLRIQLQRERQTICEAQFQQGQIRSSLYLDSASTNDLNMNTELSLQMRRQTTASPRPSQGRSNSVSPISQYME